MRMKISQMPISWSMLQNNDSEEYVDMTVKGRLSVKTSVGIDIPDCVTVWDGILAHWRLSGYSSTSCL